MSLTRNQTLLIDPNRQTVQGGTAVSSSGSSVFIGFGVKEITLFVNITVSPTGTAPTIQYTLQELDPGNETTAVGSSVSTAVLTAISTGVVRIRTTSSGAVKVSWTVTGTTPNFPTVYATLTTKATTAIAGVDPTGVERSVTVDVNGNLQVVTSIVSPSARTGIISGLVILGGGTNGTINAVRATAYTEQSANAQRSLASSSASDTAAGTGARQVTVTYYDSAMNGPFTNVVTLNGVTAVATGSSDLCYIESMRVTSVGTGGANVGTLTLFVNNAGGGGTIGTIGIGNILTGAGDRQTLWAHHYVETGKTAQLATMVASSVISGSNSSGTFFLRAKDPTTANSSELTVSEFLALSAAVVRQLAIPIKVVGPARVLAYGIPNGNSATLFASYDFSEM